MRKTFFERDWGFMHGQISKYKCDFLPRFTITTTAHMLEINIGFICFHLWLTIFSKDIQELNRRSKKYNQDLEHISDVMNRLRNDIFRQRDHKDTDTPNGD